VPRRETGAIGGCCAGDPSAGRVAAGNALVVESRSAGSFVVRCSDSAGGALKGNSSSSPGDRGSPVGADFVMTGALLVAGEAASVVSFAFWATRRPESMRVAPWGLPFAASPLGIGDVERGLCVMGETPESGEPGMLIATTACGRANGAGQTSRRGRRETVVIPHGRRVRLAGPWFSWCYTTMVRQSPSSSTKAWKYERRRLGTRSGGSYSA
jgi:hypothetical protein